MDKFISQERLIQEDYLNDPWAMLVCCILLNQTNNKQVRPVLDTLFKAIPDPESASVCDTFIISDIIRSTGFQNMKSKRIISLSKKWISGFKHPEELPGIGKYGIESWKIFVEMDFNFSPSDKKLRLFLENDGPQRIRASHFG